ncbi:DUF547 domain-containing protein [Thalassobellus suaedae]|uniref:DUF547 domain-containing protein n=1 Tax=Thalassobellus suaedae TaxID=3074124 RepID=A0ABY9Y5W9_9FLAO|nr:DUF547 domain-containing protein [Flavobacteriaceae bacterium HL-DH10]
MKYYSLIFIICCYSACSGTKLVAKKTSEISKTENDTMGYKNEPVKLIPYKTTQEITKTKLDETSTEKPVKFNQALTKRFIETHQLWDDLLRKHVTNSGLVNYLTFKEDRKSLTTYITLLSQKLPDDNWPKEDKLAYWINAYNAMTIDLILRNYPVNSIKDIKDPWKQRLWKLGHKWYNLEDIEHQILRKMNEPRIHFAIVCASYSCPKLLNKAYTASKLELQLTNATRDFLIDKNRNNITANNLELSKIFQWFSKDFKQDGSLIDFLNKYSTIKISNKAKMSFNDYNWSLNE